MKRAFAGLLLCALVAAGSSCSATFVQSDVRSDQSAPMVGGGTEVSISYFYDNLSDDGEWFQDASLGWCWTPYDVSESWRPYSAGHWEYTDYGWSWVSDESFGWATYHYGRWFFDDTYGWAWEPGTEWAPAWVAWRASDDYIGWAPLPPRANWDVTVGLSFADADVSAIPPNCWAFVPRRHVLDANVSLQVSSVARNVTLLGRTHDATRFEVREGRPANIGVDVAQLELTLGRQVPRERIVDADAPARGGGRRTGNGAVGFYRPRVKPAPATEVAPPSAGDRGTIPDATMQRERDNRQRKLESDLAAERSRLAREQQAELNAQVQGAAAEETRQRHAAEQQAFEAHAAQQRQILSQRLQKQVVRPDKPGRGRGNQGNQDNPGKGKGHDKGGQ